VLKYEKGIMSMSEGDYGLALPITITGAEIFATDKIDFFIKKGEEVIVKKTFTNIENNTFDFVLSKENSDKLPVGTYTFGIDWFREDIFMNNIKKNETFIVEDK
jgi:hypothetical protein